MRRPIVLLVFLVVGSVFKLFSDKVAEFATSGKSHETRVMAEVKESISPVQGTTTDGDGLTEEEAGESNKRLGYAFVLLSTILFVYLYIRSKVENRFSEEEMA